MIGEIEESDLSDATVLRLRGEHDLATRGAVRSALAAALQRSLPVVIDVSDVEFVDVTTLGALVCGAAAARAAGLSTVLLCGAPRAEQLVFDKTAALPDLERVRDLREARRFIRRSLR